MASVLATNSPAGRSARPLAATSSTVAPAYPISWQQQGVGQAQYSSPIAPLNSTLQQPMAPFDPQAPYDPRVLYWQQQQQILHSFQSPPSQAQVAARASQLPLSGQLLADCARARALAGARQSAPKRQRIRGRAGAAGAAGSATVAFSS